MAHDNWIASLTRKSLYCIEHYPHKLSADGRCSRCDDRAKREYRAYRVREWREYMANKPAAPALCPHRTCTYYDERSEEYCSAPSYEDQIDANCPDNTEIVPERRRGEPEGD